MNDVDPNQVLKVQLVQVVKLLPSKKQHQLNQNYHLKNQHHLLHHHHHHSSMQLTCHQKVLKYHMLKTTNHHHQDQSQ